MEDGDKIPRPINYSDASYYSRLHWGISNLFLIRTTLYLTINTVTLSAAVLSNVNISAGTMDDTDWDILSSSNHTRYSKSTTTLPRFQTFIVNFDIQYQIVDTKDFFLFGLAGLHFSRWNLYDELISYDYSNSQV